MEEPLIGLGHDEKLAQSRRLNRWLTAAIVVLVGTFVGLGVWYKLDSDDKLAETETALAQTEESLIATEERVTGLEKQIAGLQRHLASTASDFDEERQQVADFESALGNFIGKEITEAGAVGVADANCMADTLVETLGAVQVLARITEETDGSRFLLAFGIAEAAETCDVPLARILGGDRTTAQLLAPRLEEFGYFIDPDSDASEQTVAEAVEVATSAGEALYIVVLSFEPESGTIAFSDAVLDELAYGYVLTIGPQTVGYAGNGTAWSEADMNSAVDASLEATTGDELVRRFVDSLTGSSN